MADLSFPQLSTGAQVQYPLRKRRVVQSALNAFADGSTIVSNVNANTQRVWELAYIDLTSADQTALQNHFIACQGALLPFTFIDPTDNMLNSSSNLTTAAWIADPLLSVAPNATDPLGGNTAFLIVNSGQIERQISQQLLVPANYQYCFSLYALAVSPTSVGLSRSALSSQSQSYSVGANWIRLISSGQLPDEQTGFTVSVVVPAAQSVILWGPQLEPQLAPSRYRSTAGSGGVYASAHLLGNSLTFESDAPGLFSTLISIETT